ncbi:MAG: hypothetical protein AAF235_11245, partial [Planctomycetota bacterium]
MTNIYEQTLAAEYHSWLTSWIQDHPGAGFVAQHLAGPAVAPVTSVAGPGDALIGETLGLGTHGPVDAEMIARVEAGFRDAGSNRAVIEISPHADPSALAEATRAGFQLADFLDVYFIDLAEPLNPHATDISIRLVDTSDRDDIEHAARMIALGRCDQDETGAPGEAQLLISRQV